jgi:phage-related protein
VGEKPLYWVGSSKRDLSRFPEAVKDRMGTALSVAQFGGRHPSAKLWKGQGPGVLEVVEDYDRGTYRAVYAVRFEGAVYVLHAFQKKSPKGIKTSRPDIALVRERLKMAERDHEERDGKTEE